MATNRNVTFGHIRIGLEPQELARVANSETPFRVAVLADFRAGSVANPMLPASEFPKLQARLIDRDNFAKVFEQLSVSLDVTLPGGSPFTLRFGSLDDFHPDQLFANAPIFAQLSDLRRKLFDASTYEQAAAELRSLATVGSTIPEEEKPGESQPVDKPEIGARTTEGGSILDEAVAATQSGGSTSRAADDMQRMVRAIVEPYILPGPNPKQKELVALVDHLATQWMSYVLHLPRFQALEATWRGVHFLTRRLEMGAALKLFIVDLPKHVLATDVLAQQELASTRLYKTLVEDSVGTPGGEPWAILVGDYMFDRTSEDIEVLGRVAKLSAAAGAPFVTSASPHFVGCESLPAAPDPDDWDATVDPETDQAWQSLRQLPEAAYVGLALPRFLLRLPYGKDTSPIKSFDFEEMANVPKHADYLWGNSALACALLLADAFCQNGWNLRPDDHRVLEGLPVHIRTADGQREIQPCAEAWLTNRAGDVILSQGLMPVLSIKGQDAIQVARFQSVSYPATPLAGKWCG